MCKTNELNENSKPSQISQVKSASGSGESAVKFPQWGPRAPEANAYLGFI